MNRYFKTILLVSLILNYFSSSATARVERSSNNCYQVGVILKSDDPNLTGVLCKDDRLVVKDKVLITCKFNGFLGWVNPGEYNIQRFCPSSETPSRKCETVQNCYRTETKLYLIGQTFATKDLKPRLEWGPIVEAKGYSLLIQSSDGKEVYRAQVTSSEYRFTQALRPGELYQIDIFVKDKRLSDRFALHILSQDHIDELNSMLEIINSGNWTEIEKTLFRDGAYTRFGLTLEAIKNLEQSSKRHQSRELQARLGDRYLDAGYFDKAREIFEQLEQTIYEDNDNLQSQLPIKTKLPQ